MSSRLNPEKSVIAFLDFDNTITCVDVLDAVIEQFSINEDWIEYEEEWKAGRIGSQECLEVQLRSVRVRKSELAEFARQIPLDPYFKKLLGILHERRIPCQILSDSFSFIIQTILDHHGIGTGGLQVYANELQFDKDQLLPSFPYASKDCARCAHCKKSHILAHADKTRIYVGDGLSDLCPSLEADHVFAKGSLMHALKEKGKAFTPYEDLGKVAVFFESLKKNPRPEKAAAYA